MTNMRAMVGRELEWLKPSAFRRVYELRAGDTVVAEMKFDKPIGWTAEGSTGEGTWRFERTGRLFSGITVSDIATGAEVASLREKRFRRTQHVVLPDKSSYAISVNFPRTRIALTTATGETMSFVSRHGFFRVRWRTEIRYRAKSEPGMPWLVLLTWYYLLMLRSRARARHAG